MLVLAAFLAAFLGAVAGVLVGVPATVTIAAFWRQSPIAKSITQRLRPPVPEDPPPVTVKHPPQRKL